MSIEELAELVKSGKTEYIPQLWENSRKVLYRCINGFYSRYCNKCTESGVTLEDLEQECYFIFLNMIQAFDSTKGYKFLSYANLQVKTYLLRNVLHIVKGVDVEPLNISNSLDETMKIFDGDDITLLDTIEDETAAAEFEKAESKIYTRSLYTVLDELVTNHLNEQQQTVIKQRFFQNKTLEEIGQQLGVSKERARVIEFSALRRLSWNKRALYPFINIDGNIDEYSFTGSRSFNERRASSEELITEIRGRRQ